MRINVQNTLIITFIYTLLILQGHAFDLDETVDDEIRKNYNPNQLINDVGNNNTALTKKIKTAPPSEPLPELPSITKSEKKQKISNNISNNYVAKIYTGGNIKIKKGTSFNVNNINAISDWQVKGTTVKFGLKNQIVNKDFVLPATTTFIGEIIESHRPQITCNGGLVAIKINSMIYKGQTIPISAYVTRANDKKIFFNTIKGERNYLKTLWKKGNWGRVLFDKMLTLTASLGTEGSTFILSPFPLAYGTFCLGANAIASPISAFFSKGGSVSIPANSPFRIKLEENVFID